MALLSKISNNSDYDFCQLYLFLDCIIEKNLEKLKGLKTSSLFIPIGAFIFLVLFSGYVIVNIILIFGNLLQFFVQLSLKFHVCEYLI